MNSDLRSHTVGSTLNMIVFVMTNIALPTLHPHHLESGKSGLHSNAEKCDRKRQSTYSDLYLKVAQVSMIKGLHCLDKDLTLEVFMTAFPAVIPHPE